MIEEHRMRGDTTALQDKKSQGFSKVLTGHHQKTGTFTDIF
jgi:hypothetical protein